MFLYAMTNDRTILRYFPDGTARTPSINPAPEKLRGPKEDAPPKGATWRFLPNVVSSWAVLI